MPSALGKRLVYAFNSGAFFRHTRLLFRVLVLDSRDCVFDTLRIVEIFLALRARMGGIFGGCDGFGDKLTIAGGYRMPGTEKAICTWPSETRSSTAVSLRRVYKTETVVS